MGADAQALLTRMESVHSRAGTCARRHHGSATSSTPSNALTMAFVLPVLIGPWKITQPSRLSDLGELCRTGYRALISVGWPRITAAQNAPAATAIMSIMSVGCALSGNYTALFACRVVQGIGVGGEMPVAATYIKRAVASGAARRFFMLYE